MALPHKEEGLLPQDTEEALEMVHGMDLRGTALGMDPIEMGQGTGPEEMAHETTELETAEMIGEEIAIGALHVIEIAVAEPYMLPAIM
eukprot:CAMPEP_0116544730 /NCGR_PEP_ID=MMETSP0397-20121206/2275_1 /TAXON_ID=216820 /ORGANISM="Cyclophora tenuis, Strain ECT3854" /LENGTH=87 /DNA_ID=CAMNT_0004068965 /DNA_START=269 /DNA_END=532 /DNA_ORIENTATION=-